MMQVGILKHPGGHGDKDLKHVLERYYNLEVHEVWAPKFVDPDLDILFIGGGFPCMGSSDPRDCKLDQKLQDGLIRFASGKGKVIGFGNGFRLLCEIGLLPGKLEENSSRRFICKQVYIKPEDQTSPLTSGLSDETLSIPMATQYGRYTAPEEELVVMRQTEQILFRYCNEDGRITEAVNITGTTDNIAGVSNLEKTVFGMVPLPERAVTEFKFNVDGRKIFNALLDTLAG